MEVLVVSLVEGVKQSVFIGMGLTPSLPYILLRGYSVDHLGQGKHVHG